jgi:hypothetical protein
MLVVTYVRLSICSGRQRLARKRSKKVFIHSPSYNTVKKYLVRKRAVDITQAIGR